MIDQGSSAGMRGGSRALPVADVIAGVVAWLDRTPQAVVGLLARLVPAVVFWQSGRTKVEGLAIRDTTYFLFQEEYRVPIIPPDVAAVVATIAEHVFPVLLVIGLASRFSALALLFMTLVIQTFVYPEAYLTHGLWAVAFLTVIAHGPGAVSIDHLVRRWYERRRTGSVSAQD